MPRLYSFRLRPVRSARPARPVAPAPKPVVEPISLEAAAERVAEAFASAPPVATAADSLFKMTKLELIALAEERGVDASGSRAEILGRLSHG